MKFSMIHATVLCFAAISFAAPLMSTVDIDNLAERSYDVDELNAHEWYALEPRVVVFHKAGPNTKKAAHVFIDSAEKGKQLNRAAEAATSTKTAKSNAAFHLDRQKPVYGQGRHKVAVQLNRVAKGDPSTVGQVVIHGHQPSDRRVAKALKQSVIRGKETHIKHPLSKKGRNIASAHAAQETKKARVKAKQAAGMNRAAKGIFKKGRK